MLPSFSWILAITLGGATTDARERCRAGPLDRADVIECAQREHPLVQADEAALAAVAARRQSARVALPSHPQIEIAGATRKASGIPQTWNLYGTLRQELEVGGQRRRRMDVAAAEHDVAGARARTTRRDVTVDALLAYYDVLAVRERRALVDQARRVAEALAGLAAARTKAGAEAGLSADLAEIAAVALARRVLEHRRDEAVAEARLARSLGLAPDELPEVTGALAPLAIGETPGDPSARSELAEARATMDLRARETSLVRRELVPNPSVSVFVQRDGFAELVIGAGVALPLPLPGPVGPFAKSRVAEARARQRQAARERDAVERGIRLEIDVAREELRTRTSFVDLYREDTLKRAREDLDALAAALASGSIDVRSALLAQQQLLDFLEADVTSRHELCRAAVEAARALGLDWEELR
jgi:cobalt-zinc-cadmium efflux system outer membrane protein